MKESEDFGLPKKFNKNPSKSSTSLVKYFWYLIFTFTIVALAYYVIKKIRFLNPVQIEVTKKNISEKKEDTIVETFLEKKEKGIFEINDFSGFYYVIVGSFIDPYQANDLAKKLQNKFKAIYYLFREGDIFNYVAVERYNEFIEASDARDRLIKLGFSGSWVIKY